MLIHSYFQPATGSGNKTFRLGDKDTGGWRQSEPLKGWQGDRGGEEWADTTNTYSPQLRKDGLSSGQR